MRKAGKPNSFLKGMQFDMDPGIQPKDTYRYAKNVRLNSYKGKNVSIHPYDSDRLTLNLNGTTSTQTSGAQEYIIPPISQWSQFQDAISSSDGLDLTFGSFLQWGVDEGYFNISNFIQSPFGDDLPGLPNEDMVEIILFAASTNPDGYPYNGDENNLIGPLSEWLGFFEYLQVGVQAIPTSFIFSELGDSDGVGLTFTTTITTDVNEYVVTTEVPAGVDQETIAGTSYFENLIAQSINDSDNGLLCSVFTVNVFEYTLSTFVIQSLVGVETVEVVTIDATGSLIVQPFLETEGFENLQNDFASAFQVTFAWYAVSILGYAPGSTNTWIECMGYIGQALAGWFVNYIGDINTEEVDSILGGLTTIEIEEQQVFNGAFGAVEVPDGDNYEAFQAPEMQIVGTYAFSDYLVLLGTWINSEEISNTPADFILKTSQKRDGMLVTPANMQEGDIFQMFFMGDLGFSNRKQLKVVGSEESDQIRRLYFTDGDFPLRTINVGADPSIYTPYTNQPTFFDLFVEAKQSQPKITGFSEGGSLDSVAHAYCFRYKTRDGRYSRISPVCNPASLPVTTKNTQAAFTRGANADVNTGKSIQGIIEDVDASFPFLEVIHVPYLNGVPGTAQVINTIAIPNTQGVVDINFVHTGTETIMEEISVMEFQINSVSWDICKALEVKDNRLFCGNLKGGSARIDTDFTVASYNEANLHHSYEGGNPDLFDDLLYSKGGLKFNNDGDSANVYVTDSPLEGGYVKPEGKDLYRYIKGPDEPDGEGEGGSALYNFTHQMHDGIIHYDDVNEPVAWGGKRGVFGAESKYFNTPMDNGEYEGVRVTFRILGANNTPGNAIQLDDSNNLITTGNNKGASAPFYTLNQSAGDGNYYASYANPIYNSNYVGYTRGEIYRFGILFYDKKGSPMFVKRIGDVRMPEHSAEYIVPQYDAQGGIYLTTTEWPYYYQTSRSDLDGGFLDWPGEDFSTSYYKKPYTDGLTAKGEGQYGCVLYPYFEVKLSQETASKVSGYTIVRVERTPQQRTIVTNGVLNRAVKYQDPGLACFNSDEGEGDFRWWGANRVGMEGKFGNDPIPFWTPTIQSYRSNRYGNNRKSYNSSGSSSTQVPSIELLQASGVTNPIGGDPDWSHSNIYTLDSPDAIINDTFDLNFASGDRLKITESRYCIKEAVQNGGTSGNPWQAFMNHYLADGTYPGRYGDFLPNDSHRDYPRPPRSVSLFACCIQPSLLEGGDIYYGGTNVSFGGYEHTFSVQASQSTNWASDWRVFHLKMGYDNWATWQGDDDAYNAWLDVDDQPTPNDQRWNKKFNFGIYTKFYSKRIGAYPMYGMARPDWNKFYLNSNQVDGTGEGYSINSRTIWYDNFKYTPQFLAGNAWGGNDTWFNNLNLGTSGFDQENGARACNILPDIIANGGLDGATNLPGERLDVYSSADYTGSSGHWNESKILFAKVVSPGETVSEADLGSDRAYTNSTMWHDFHGYGISGSDNSGKFALNSDRTGSNMQLGGNTGLDTTDSDDEYGTYTEEYADFAQCNRTIVLSLGNHGMLPITRHCLQRNNWRERVFWQFGGSNFRCPIGTITGVAVDDMNYAGIPGGATSMTAGSRWSQYSPEMTMAAIVKQQTADTLYGGRTSVSFARNTFISTGAFQPVNSLEDTMTYGHDGLHVFGGDTYICNFSLKKTLNQETSMESTSPDSNVTYNFAERGVLTAYTCPVETETNLDLRHGYFFGGDTQNIVKQIPDDFGASAYNNSYDSDNTIRLFNPRPTDFVEIDHWPTTVAFSEIKLAGDFGDAFSIFPPNQIKDLDYRKGPINQLLNFQDKLFALQDSGTCLLSVNPRVLIPAGESGHITTVTGTDKVIERFDYVSESYGSQHMHGLAVTDNGAYYFDANASKFLKLGRTQGGGFGVTSLGDSLGVQTHFQKYMNTKINDNPLFSYSAETQVEMDAYMSEFYAYQQLISQQASGTVEMLNYILYGGISIGYDPEYGEILLTIYPEATDVLSGGVNNYNPTTIVYSEPLNMFTSFVSKRPSMYFNFNNRMYSLYDYGERGNTKIYLANGYATTSASSMDGAYESTWVNENYIENNQADPDENKYLYFGGFDYYIYGHPLNSEYEYNLGGGSEEENDEDEYTYEYSKPIYTGEYGNLGERSLLATPGHISIEPIQLHFVLNDELHQTKIFDNIDINFKGDTQIGNNHLYFRRFVFLGSANTYGIDEWDASEYTNLLDGPGGNVLSPVYSNAKNGFDADPDKKMWYVVKDGTHHIPMRSTKQGQLMANYVVTKPGINENVTRGNYAVVAMVMGWDEGVQFFGESTGQFKTAYSNVDYSGNLKDEGFSILSIVPYYRYSRR